MTQPNYYYFFFFWFCKGRAETFGCRQKNYKLWRLLVLSLSCTQAILIWMMMGVRKKNKKGGEKPLESSQNTKTGLRTRLEKIRQSLKTIYLYPTGLHTWLLRFLPLLNTNGSSLLINIRHYHILINAIITKLLSIAIIQINAPLAARVRVVRDAANSIGADTDFARRMRPFMCANRVNGLCCWQSR